ncbi:MAG TPA: gamma-glutamyltransferase [Verrucomicrobiae bacterium]|nr:gamma-glutamyltransferase [Verrucomicrobiae bacterium]
MKWRLCLLLLISPAVYSAPASHGAVATVHPLATEAALEALRSGGNAVDAAVAAALTLGVVDSHNSGLGGGCFLLLRTPDGSFVAIDGREQAPAAATADMFVREGKANPRLSQFGALAIAVPGALAAYDYASRTHGRIPLARHLEAAAQLAANGFQVTRALAKRLEENAGELRQFESSRAAYLKPDGAPWREGDLFVQPDLAQSYKSIASEGAAWFYVGHFASAAAAWMKASGGLVTAEDFKSYQFKLREPVRTTYRGCEVVGFPPPSSGGVHVGQILNILEHFDLKKLGPESPEFVHLVAEAMKLAFADRAHWLGDPDFASVPRGLASKEYAARLASKIDRKHASVVAGHETPPRSTEDVFGKHTTHFSAADAEGYWVACTATINTSFGSKAVIPGTGIVMNNQMDDFSLQPGVPNYFGLVGGEANAIAPGKRPLSSMSPTLVLRDGRPILSVGAAGGPTIISQTLLAILYVVDFGMPAGKALAMPRFHHQWLPDELRVERSMPEKIVRELEKRGHKLKVVDSIGAAQAVVLDERKSGFTGVADPRTEGKAGAF